MKTSLLEKLFAFICLCCLGASFFTVNNLLPQLAIQDQEMVVMATDAQSLLEVMDNNEIVALKENNDFKDLDSATNMGIAYTSGSMNVDASDFVQEAAAIYDFSTIGDSAIQQKVAAYQEALRKQQVASERARRGSLGRLSIPSVGIDVAVFGGMSQGIVDAADSAALFGLHGGSIIGDHNYQGFGRIRNMRVGSYAYFEDGNTKTRYVCTGKITNGTNTKADLVNASGGCVCGGAPGGYVLYTCNDWSGRSITIVFLQPG